MKFLIIDDKMCDNRTQLGNFNGKKCPREYLNKPCHRTWKSRWLWGNTI